MDRELRVVLSARVFSNQKCFGPGVSQLLKRVDELHSLRAAALSMSMAYSKAWTVVRNAEDGLGFHLLTSTAGGKHGGGAVLTDEARQMIDAYDAYCEKLRAYGEKLFEETYGLTMSRSTCTSAPGAAAWHFLSRRRSASAAFQMPAKEKR